MIRIRRTRTWYARPRAGRVFAGTPACDDARRDLPDEAQGDAITAVFQPEENVFGWIRPLRDGELVNPGNSGFDRPSRAADHGARERYGRVQRTGIPIGN